ncbi:MAG: hypothetical protein IJ702_04280 [Fretibacterium sp.]|nr:hypothetical protein [Fretibacterium sp.]
MNTESRMTLRRAPHRQKLTGLTLTLTLEDRTDRSIISPDILSPLHLLACVMEGAGNTPCRFDFQ